MSGRRAFRGAVLALCMIFVAGFVSKVCASDVKACFVYQGAVKDAGWNFAHDTGRKALEGIPGVTTAFVESVSEGAFAETVLKNLVEQDCGLIFATSYGHLDPVLKVAGEAPGTVFMHCAGFKRQKNVGTYFGRIHEAMYLAGMVAGSMTKSGELGFVAAHPIAEVIRNINAFTLGARSVNPAVKVRVAWTRAWFDPVKEKGAAMAFFDSGVDVIAQHQNSPVCMLAARERGKYAVGYNTDMSVFAPESALTSAVWNWEPLYRHIVEEVRNGTWTSRDLVWGLDRGVVDLAPMGPMVPKEIEARVLAKKAEIAEGRFKPFTGPVEDQDGKVRIHAGELASEADLLNMTWLVKGTVGTVE